MRKLSTAAQVQRASTILGRSFWKTRKFAVVPRQRKQVHKIRIQKRSSKLTKGNDFDSKSRFSKTGVFDVKMGSNRFQ